MPEKGRKEKLVDADELSLVHDRHVYGWRRGLKKKLKRRIGKHVRREGKEALRTD